MLDLSSSVPEAVYLATLSTHHCLAKEHLWLVIKMGLVSVAETQGRSGVVCVSLGTIWRPEDWGIGHLCTHSLLHAWWEIYSKALIAEAGVGGSAKGLSSCSGSCSILSFQIYWSSIIYLSVCDSSF